MSDTQEAPVRVVVNGEPRELRARSTVAAALERLGVAGDGIAVERNGRVVPRSQHATTVLEEGDRLEIVTFVGGG